MLNAMQERFVVEYCKDLNATEAAIRAGYSKKGAGQSAHKLLKNTEIKQAIAEAQKKVLERAELTAQRTLEEMRRVGFVNVQDLFDERGDLLPIHKLPRDVAAAIGSFEVIMKNAAGGDGKIDRVLKVKMLDKPRVLEMLGKHFKLLSDVVQLEASDKLIEALYQGRQRAAEARKGGKK